MEEDALSAGVGVRQQPREGLTWVSIPASSQLHTPYHNYRKLSHALALPLPLLQGKESQQPFLGISMLADRCGRKPSLGQLHPDLPHSWQ